MNSRSRKFVFFGVLCAATIVLAQESSPFAEQGMKPEDAAKYRELMARKARRVQERGGWVDVAPTGGVIRVISAQTKIAEADLKESIDVFASTLRLPVQWTAGAADAKCAGAIASAANKDGKCAAAIVLVDKPDAPRILIAPEDGWAMINLARLAEDNPPKEKLVRRAKQEYWRAASMLLGAYVSMQQPCLLTLITNNAALDGNVCVIPSIEVLPKVTACAKKLGIKPGKRVVYERACREGWAPEPTNDVQRAVWKRVHELPTTPIEIKPEKK